MAGSAAPRPPDVPPVDCCIYYGSNYLRLHAEDFGAFAAPQDQPRESAEELLKQPEEQPPLGASLDDFLFLVPQQQLRAWHAENIKNSSHHYGPLIKCAARLRGPLAAAGLAVRLTEASGVSILFNCRVPLRPGSNKLCKYGVVSTEAFLEDLSAWRHFYFAGRMQKPVEMRWSSAANEKIPHAEEVLRVNRLNALRLGLLLLPKEASVKRLLESIVSLSYQGDFRMLLAEDPNKVQAIVDRQAAELCKIYLPLLAEIPSAHLEMETGGDSSLAALLKDKTNNTICTKHEKAVAAAVENEMLRVRQDTSPAASAALYASLPLSFRQSSEAISAARRKSFLNFFSGRPLGEEPLKTHACKDTMGLAAPPPAAALRLGLRQLMFLPTLKCSLKNAVAAGLATSTVYGLRKVGKRLKT